MDGSRDEGGEELVGLLVLGRGEDVEVALGTSVESVRECVEQPMLEKNDSMELDDHNGSSTVELAVVCQEGVVASCLDAEAAAATSDATGYLNSEIEEVVVLGSEQILDIECRVSRICLSEADECKGESTSSALGSEAKSADSLGFCSKVDLSNSSGDGQMCTDSLFLDTVPSGSVVSMEFNHERSTAEPSLMKDDAVVEEKDGGFCGLESKMCSEVSLRDIECETRTFEETDREASGSCVVSNAGEGVADKDLDAGKSTKEIGAVQSNVEMVNGIIGAGTSVSVDDMPCRVCDDGKDHGIVYEAHKAKLLEGQSSSLRRSSRHNKYVIKADKPQVTKKGSVKPSRASCTDGSIDFFPKAVRRKRSYSRNLTRSSCWGFKTNFEQGCGTSAQGVLNQNLKKKKGGKGSKSQIKSKVSTSASAAKTKSVHSGTIRLKVVFGKKADQGAAQVAHSQGLAAVEISDGDKVILGDNLLTSSLPLPKAENFKKGPVQQKLSQMSSCFFPGNNSNKSMTCEKLSEDDHSVCKDVASSILASKAVVDHCTGVLLVDLGKSCYNHERCSDPGTSPDSEVINNVIDSEAGPVALGVLDAAVDSSDYNINCIVPDSSRSMKKGNINCNVAQANSLHVEDGVNFPAYKTEIKVYKKSRKPQKAVKPEELHSLTDIQTDELSKSLKSAGGCWNKSRINAAAIPEEDASDQCEWDNKKPTHKALVKNDIYDADDKKEVFAAGNDVDDETSNTNSGVTSGDASSQATVPSGESTGLHKFRLKDAWVCCDDCDKWRRIPAALADIIEEKNCRWTCKDNHDKAFAECSMPQEKSDAAINIELELSDEEDGPNAHSGTKTYERSHVHEPPSWTHISTNLFLHRGRKTQTMDEVMICGCKPPKDGKVGCRNGCLNRILNIECVKGTCPCGDLCSNQQFQKKKYVPLKLFRCGKKGHGLQVLEDIVDGQFIIEYVGEVLDLPSYEARQRDYASNGHKHFYFMTLDANEVIDACAKGNLGRYINHSCDPNCSTEKWIVNGEICIGLFANRNIKKGEELTFDYNYVRVFGAAAKKCYCGAAKCRGYIGGDVNAEEVVQGDSDDEYLDPVVVYENGEIRNGLDNVNALSNFMDVEIANIIPEQTLVISTEELDVAIKEEKSDTTVEQLVMDSGKDSSSESLVNLSTVGKSFGKTESMQTDDVSEKSVTHLQIEIPSEREMVGTSASSIQRPDCSSENGRREKCSSKYAGTLLKKPDAEMVDRKQAHPKLHPRMKISRASKPVKIHNIGINTTTDNKAIMAKIKSNAPLLAPKKLPDDSANHKLETVERKLNDLLDVDGGICKRKDASRGYLKLLLLTAASGDNGPGNGGTIQRNRDLSMILDALLKTKSRGVLSDIINKNGLQMLHNMMKQYRRDFNRTPILRKLLKVLEFLAEKEVLTGERINADPRCLGVESLRVSLLALTEHQDKKVHQIARSFRDKWIPRVRKISSMDTNDRKNEANRSIGAHHRWRDHETRPSEAIVCMNLDEQTRNTLTAARMEVSPSSHVNNGVTAFSRTRKRKSRWDQPLDRSFPFKQQKLQHINRTRHDDWSCFADCVQSSYEEMMDIKEDAPPGFSSPPPPGFSSHPSGFSTPPPGFSSAIGCSHLQSFTGPTAAAIPAEISIGQPQERFNSRLTVSYGIPFLAVQQYGTPLIDQIDGWAVAPGVPFQPFPPLPPYHRGNEGIVRQNSTAVVAERGLSQEHSAPVPYRSDQDIPCTSSSVCHDVIAASVVPFHHPPALQSGGGNSGILGRKYFKQQKWTKRRPPWLRRKEW